jgi:hypothetical protein
LWKKEKQQQHNTTQQKLRFPSFFFHTFCVLAKLDPSTSVPLATMRFSELVALVLVVSPVASFVLPSRKQTGGRDWRVAEDRHATSKLHVSPIMDIAMAIADGSTASTASAIELGNLPLLLAPLAALAAGRQALKNRDNLQSEMTFTEQALEQIKKQMKEANNGVAVSLSLVDGQLVGCISCCLDFSKRRRCKSFSWAFILLLLFI